MRMVLAYRYMYTTTRLDIINFVIRVLDKKETCFRWQFISVFLHLYRPMDK